MNFEKINSDQILMKLRATVVAVTARITQRSQATRSSYLQRLDAASRRKPGTERMGCANVAHALAAMPEQDKALALPASRKIPIAAPRAPNIGIVTAYNDMLSAHAPFQGYPELVKAEARKWGATAQVAGGVPAMCDGVTQGTAGMELSLYSRDVIAMATAVALSHDMFDGALMLGVCDKIVPGLLFGALHFGHLPTVFVPAGPTTSGLSNNAKRQGARVGGAGSGGPGRAARGRVAGLPWLVTDGRMKWRVGQGAGCHPCLARGGRRWPAGAAA